MTAKDRSRILVLVGWVGAIATWLIVSRSRGTGAVEAADSLRGVLVDNWWGPVLYIAVYTVRPVILFPASVLTVLGGLAFGVGPGVAYTVVGSNLSTAATYAGARFVAGRASTADGWTPPFGRRAVAGLVANPFETTLVLRLIAVPFDAVGLAAGALGLRFWPFLAGSFLGTIAGTIAFVSFGASIDSLTDDAPGFDPTLLIVSVALTAAGIVAASVMRRRRPELTDEPTSRQPTPQEDEPVEIEP